MNRTDAAVREEAPPFWEWVVAGVGLVLLLASLGYLGWHAVVTPHTPPSPEIELVGVEQQGSRFLAQVRVRNRGTLTAEKLVVSGRLKRGDETVEESEAEFDHLPGESTREGGLFFSRDPRSLQLELRARSYLKP
jgi:uncharacterized protein (TIGR02588 family)